MLRPDDLVSLGRVFSSNVDDANFSGKMANYSTALDALRRERESLETAARRRHEVEVHLARVRRTALERRINETQAPVRPTPSAAAAKHVAAAASASMASAASDAAAELKKAKRHLSLAVEAALPELQETRRAAELAAITRVRDELEDVEERRGEAQRKFAEELKAQAELAKEKQRLHLANKLANDESEAHDALRRSLFIDQAAGTASSIAPPPAWAAAAALGASAADAATHPPGGPPDGLRHHSGERAGRQRRPRGGGRPCGCWRWGGGAAGW
jgi:hypothetical protein